MSRASLSITAEAPLLSSRAFKDDALGEKLDGYGHEVRADGGYWSATINLKIPRKQVDEWFDQGLMRHIEVYNPAAVRVWEGFVNEVEIGMGSLSAKRGPVMGIANKVKLLYRTVLYNTNPPIGGEEAETTFESDTDSQAIYGVHEEIVSAGERSSTEAEEARGTYLAKHAWPDTSQQVSIRGGGDEPSVTLSCLGYVHLLQKYYYSQTVTAGEQNLSAQLGDIFDGDPNSLFSASNARLATNTIQVGQYAEGDKTAWEQIKALVALGDTLDNRHIIGVYNDREVRYEAVPTSIAYSHSLSSPDQRVVNYNDESYVYVWDIDAGRWLMVSDFLAGRSVDASLYRDPRTMFIEAARYEAPWFVDLSGGKADRLGQKLTRLGLGSE